MRRLVFFAAALLLLLAALFYANTQLVVHPTRTPAPLAALPPLPTPTPSPARTPRVVLLALAGLGADQFERCRLAMSLPRWQALATSGARAAYALSVDPPDTAPAHAALATGAFPGGSGIVANRFHRPGDDIDGTVDACVTAPLAAEPFWRTAMRRGLYTAAICWPGLSPEMPETLADYTVVPPVVDIPSALHAITLTEASGWSGDIASFSPPREGVLILRRDGTAVAELHLLARDTMDDGQINYDAVSISHDRWLAPSAPRLHAGDTVPVALPPHLMGSAYLSVVAVSAEAATLYQSPVCYNDAYPAELLQGINGLGHPAPPPDGEALRRGWITPDLYQKQVEIRARWVLSATEYVLARYQPDLLVASTDAAQALQAPFLLLDERQPGYGPEQVAAASRRACAGCRLADEAIGLLMDRLDLKTTSLLVVSDHGMAPVHTQVHLNALLRQSGLLVELPGAAGVNRQRSRALATGSGGAAHIQINLRGRERGGIVPTESYASVQDEIVARLEALQDTTETRLFARILRRQELANLNLEAEGAGDVFVLAAPGVCLSDSLGAASVLAPPPVLGASGYDATIPPMLGIFVAAGPRWQQGIEGGPVHVCDMAPTVASLLGLTPPGTCTGRVLSELMLPKP
ncbi:MAG: alkaline phosphatase family protein [Anaerolineae bacterium]